MIIINRRTVLAVLAGAAVLASAPGCGDGDGVTNTPSDTLFLPDGTFPDTQGTTNPDTATGTNTQPTDTAQDTAPDTSAPDLIPDEEPWSIVSTVPADGATNVALPLRVTITFSEPLFAPTISPQTIQVRDVEGTAIPGTPTLSADGITVTWAPTANDQALATPYVIWVDGTVIKDKAGNEPSAFLEFTFTTANYPDQNGYRALAEKYAPKVYSAVTDRVSSEWQVPTKVDLDGDWDAKNNRDWVIQSATSLIPALYYNVAETYTHYYIHYHLFFPWVNDTNGQRAHTNGGAGYMVTIEKAHDAVVERPIALHTWWKNGNSDENYAFVTDESGIAPTDDAKFWFAHARMSQANLFPEGRFEAYITARTHRACVWGWDDGGFGEGCEFSANIGAGDKLVFEYKNGQPTPVQKGTAGWPIDIDEVDGLDAYGYALIPMLSSLWPRRFSQGPTGLFQSDTFTYGADSVVDPGSFGRGTKLTNKFVNALVTGAFGRAPWAWHYNPGTNHGTADSRAGRMHVGQMTMDPAWYVFRRHHSTVNDSALVQWNDDAGTGFAVDYCFNGVAGVDNRTTDVRCQ